MDCCGQVFGTGSSYLEYPGFDNLSEVRLGQQIIFVPLLQIYLDLIFT